jgi:aryl-alcohol dehydrogenase-like predicted oxidoreductase
VRLVRHAFDAGVRYFDTSPDYDESESRCGEALQDIRDKIYLATKANIDFDSAPFDAGRVRDGVQTSMKALRTDYLDCVQIHMPHDYDKAMRARDVLDGMRQQGKIRFIGVTNHQNFDVTWRLISTDAFDQVLLAYGYFNGGLGRIYTDRSREYRNLALAKAHELGMGIVAMKVMGATVLGHNAIRLVPDYDARNLDRLPAAAIRWVLSDDRIQILNIGFSMQTDIDRNIETLRGDLQLTAADRDLLADFTRRVYESDAGRNMKMV